MSKATRSFRRARDLLHKSLADSGLNEPCLWVTSPNDCLCAFCGSPECEHVNSWYAQCFDWEIQWELVRCGDCHRSTVWKMINQVVQLALF